MEEREVNSIGQTITPQADFAAMLAEAEKKAEADYEIKHSGRNRVERTLAMGTASAPGAPALAFSVSPVEKGVVVTIPFGVIPEQFTSWWDFVGQMVTAARAASSVEPPPAPQPGENGSLPRPGAPPPESAPAVESAGPPPDIVDDPSSSA